MSEMDDISFRIKLYDENNVNDNVFLNKFFRLSVIAKNNIAKNWGNKGDYYYIRYGNPDKPTNIPTINLLQTNNKSYNMELNWVTWNSNYKTSINTNSALIDNRYDDFNTIPLSDYEFVIHAEDQTNSSNDSIRYWYIREKNYNSSEPMTKTTNNHYFIPLSDESKNYKYKVKFRVRNILFGTKPTSGWSTSSYNNNIGILNNSTHNNNFSGWSEYTSFSDFFVPNVPNAPISLSKKFYEQGNKSINTHDFVEYTFDTPTNKGGNNINIQEYKLNYKKSQTENETIVLSSSNSNTEPIKDYIYKYDSNMIDLSFSFSVSAKNFFMSNYSVSANYITVPIAHPDKLILFTTIGIDNNFSFILNNSNMLLNIREPTNSVIDSYIQNKLSYNTAHFHNESAISVLEASMNILDDNDILYSIIDIKDTIQIAKHIFNFEINTTINNLYDLSNNNELVYKFACKNVLSSTYSPTEEFKIIYKKPVSNNFDNASTLSWNSSTNKIFLNLSRADGGINTSNSILPLTITPENLKFSNTVSELLWEVKSNPFILNGISNIYTDYNNNSYNSNDYLINSIGDISLDILYTISYRCRNRYVDDYIDEKTCKIKIVKPNSPSIDINQLYIVDSHPNNQKNKITINWTKPSNTGLQISNNDSNPSDNNTLKIYKYHVYIKKSTDTDYNTYFEIASSSSTDDANNSLTIISNTTTDYNGNTYSILPDTQYEIQISAYNWIKKSTEGNRTSWSLTTDNQSVPKTIVDIDREMKPGYIPIISNIGGNYSNSSSSEYYYLSGETSVQQTNEVVKNINAINTESSKISPILANFSYNKPNSNTEPLFGVRFKIVNMDNTPNTDLLETDITKVTKDTLNGQIDIKKLGVVYAKLKLDTSILDIYKDSDSFIDNSGQWYKINGIEYELIKNAIRDYTPNIYSKKVRFQIIFNYYDKDGNSTGDIISDINSAGNYFGKVNSIPSDLKIISIQYDPYYVCKIPTLRPNKFQKAIIKYEFDNKTPYYVMNWLTKNYIRDGNYLYLNNTVDLSYGTDLLKKDSSSWNNNPIIKTNNNGIDILNNGNNIKTNGVFSQNIKFVFNARNIKGESDLSYGEQKFIYDKDTYAMLDSIDSNSSNKIHGSIDDLPATSLSILDNNILKIPNNFDPFKYNNTNSNTVYTYINNSNTEWIDGLFKSIYDSSSNDISNNLIPYKGTFMTPKSFKNNITSDSNYKFLYNFYNNELKIDSHLDYNIYTEGNDVFTKYYRWIGFQVNIKMTGNTLPSTGHVKFKINTSSGSLTQSNLNTGNLNTSHNVEVWTKTSKNFQEESYFHRLYTNTYADTSTISAILNGQLKNRSSMIQLPSSDNEMKVAIKKHQLNNNDILNIFILIGVKNELNLNIKNIVITEIGKG